MPSIVLDREEMKSQTESVVASARQPGASAEKGWPPDDPTSPVGKNGSFSALVCSTCFSVGFRRETGDTAVFPLAQKDLGLLTRRSVSPVPPYC